MTDWAGISFEHARHLAVEIGGRTIGSQGNQAAESYIAQVFRGLGLKVETQELVCPDWVEVETHLELGGEVVEAFANTFSPSAEVSAPTVPVGTVDELEAASITGCIPVFYGALAQAEIAAKRAIYVSERDRRIIRLLEERGALGVITVNPTLHDHWRLIEDFDLSIPSVTVTAHAGLRLLKRAGEPVKMHIVTSRRPSRSANVISRLAGELPEKIVLCAHYDTKVDTPGAYDNATGVAALLTLASCLVDARPRLKHTLEWVAFSGEEIYGLGDMEYARQVKDGFNQMAAAINFDGIGPLVASTSIATFAASQPFCALVDRLAAGYPAVIRVDPWPASDHYLFYSNQVPSIAFSSVGIRDIYHTSADTIDWLSPGKMAEAIRLAVDIITELDAQELAWGRPS